MSVHKISARFFGSLNVEWPYYIKCDSAMSLAKQFSSILAAKINFVTVSLYEAAGYLVVLIG